MREKIPKKLYVIFNIGFFCHFHFEFFLFHDRNQRNHTPLDPAVQFACHAATDLKLSASRTGDECVINRYNFYLTFVQMLVLFS